MSASIMCRSLRRLGKTDEEEEEGGDGLLGMERIEHRHHRRRRRRKRKRRPMTNATPTTVVDGKVIPAKINNAQHQNNGTTKIGNGSGMLMRC